MTLAISGSDTSNTSLYQLLKQIRVSSQDSSTKSGSVSQNGGTDASSSFAASLDTSTGTDGASSSTGTQPSKLVSDLKALLVKLQYSSDGTSATSSSTTGTAQADTTSSTSNTNSTSSTSTTTTDGSDSVADDLNALLSDLSKQKVGHGHHHHHHGSATAATSSVDTGSTAQAATGSTQSQADDPAAQFLQAIQSYAKAYGNTAAAQTQSTGTAIAA